MGLLNKILQPRTYSLHDAFHVAEVIALGDMEAPVRVLILFNALRWILCADSKHTRWAIGLPFTPAQAARIPLHIYMSKNVQTINLSFIYYLSQNITFFFNQIKSH